MTNVVVLEYDGSIRPALHQDGRYFPDMSLGTYESQLVDAISSYTAIAETLERLL